MPKRRWTQAEVRSLIHQVVRECKDLSSIRIRGRSKSAVNNKRRRLRDGHLLRGKRTKHHRPWTIRELNGLRKLTRAGLSAKYIADFHLIFDRTEYAISKMMSRHNLGDPKIKENAKNARRLSPDEKVKLERFLLKKARRMSSRRVADLFGLSPKTINRWRRRLGVAPTWHEARKQS